MIRGYRWHVLGLILLFFIFTALLERSIGGLFQYLGTEALLLRAYDQWAYILGTTTLMILNQAMFGMLSGLAAAYSFLHLVRVKDGKSGAELALIFN